MSQACLRAGRNLTQDEWESYFEVDQDHPQTCPGWPAHPTVIKALVVQGKIDKALEFFHRAANLDPNLGLDPETEVAGLLLEQASEHTRVDNYDRD